MILEIQEVYQLAYDTAVEVKERYDEVGLSKYSDFPVLEMAQYATSIAWVESNFDTNARNPASSARGLMQTLKGTKGWVEENFLKIPVAPLSKQFEPEYSMMLGIAYLAYQYDRYGGNWDKVVHSYHQGSYPGTHYNDGVAYRQKVNSAYGELAFNNVDIQEEFALQQAGGSIVGLVLLVSAAVSTYYFMKK